MSNLPGVIRSSVTSKTKVSGVPDPVNKGVFGKPEVRFPGVFRCAAPDVELPIPGIANQRKAKAVMCGALLHLFGRLCVIKIG
jgi:hypothetical protein